MPDVEGSDVSIQARRAQVLALHSRGLRQEEIAAKLGIDQSTVSRDLRRLRKLSARAITQQVLDQMFEFRSWDAGVGEVMRKAGEIADDEKVSHRVRIKALAFLVECYNSRLETMVREPDPEYNAWDHAEEIVKKAVYMDEELEEPHEHEGQQSATHTPDQGSSD
jgi:DNA-binding CsgD family transcriptional regulator